MYLVDDFFKFEEESKLFEFRNEKGIYLWDLFRFDIFTSLQLKDNPVNKIPQKKIKFLILLKQALSVSKFLFIYFFSNKKYDNLFLVTSRNKLNGSFFDQNIYDVYKFKDTEKNFIIETFSKSDSYIGTYFLLSTIIYAFKIRKKINLSADDELCIKKIKLQVEKRFAPISIDFEMLKKLLIKFYFDSYIYEKLINKFKFSKIFITQNCLQKGLFNSAKKLNIPVYEIQHGEIIKEHLVYSYPKYPEIEKYIYIPYKYLTFSNLWTKNFFCPIKCSAIGNNYFCKTVKKKEKTNEILVISADVYGVPLSDFIESIIEEKSFAGYKFIYKLHPNEYYNKEYYQKKFKDSVIIKTNEQSVNELLSTSAAMICVDSTAAYEALQNNVRVLVYEIPPYENMRSIFEDQNVSLFRNVEELKKVINEIVPKDYNPPVFFEECTSEKIKRAIDE